MSEETQFIARTLQLHLVVRPVANVDLESWEVGVKYFFQLLTLVTKSFGANPLEVGPRMGSNVNVSLSSLFRPTKKYFLKGFVPFFLDEIFFFALIFIRLFSTGNSFDFFTRNNPRDDLKLGDHYLWLVSNDDQWSGSWIDAFSYSSNEQKEPMRIERRTEGGEKDEREREVNERGCIPNAES